MQTCIKKVRDQTPPLTLADFRDKALDKTLKAKNPNLYYGNLNIECYYFCQQYKDRFETIRAKKYKRISFVALFL